MTKSMTKYLWQLVPPFYYFFCWYFLLSLTMLLLKCCTHFRFRHVWPADSKWTDFDLCLKWLSGMCHLSPWIDDWLCWSYINATSRVVIQSVGKVTKIHRYMIQGLCLKVTLRQNIQRFVLFLSWKKVNIHIYRYIYRSVFWCIIWSKVTVFIHSGCLFRERVFSYYFYVTWPMEKDSLRLHTRLLFPVFILHSDMNLALFYLNHTCKQNTNLFPL